MILVTGASGFVGSALISRLSKEKIDVTAAVRSIKDCFPSGVHVFEVGNLLPTTQWGLALKGVNTVVHTAARAHVMDDRTDDPLAEFRLVNVGGTLNLAKQAAAEGVKRFVFISSIKVNGESTQKGRPFHPSDEPSPSDPYGISKYEAEVGLRRLASECGMEVVIIRPPLVYGPDVKANFLNMMRWLYKGIPLPFGAINNRRSLVYVDNLVDLILRCTDHPAAANQIFLAGDGEDLSTTNMLRRMGYALGRPARLLPVPAKILEVGAALLGKQALAQRLCGSLQVDISMAQHLLEWNPPVSVDEGLRRTADDFLANRLFIAS